jgi:hypothetical protein
MSITQFHEWSHTLNSLVTIHNLLDDTPSVSQRRVLMYATPSIELEGLDTRSLHTEITFSDKRENSIRRSRDSHMRLVIVLWDNRNFLWRKKVGLHRQFTTTFWKVLKERIRKCCLPWDIVTDSGLDDVESDSETEDPPWTTAKFAVCSDGTFTEDAGSDWTISGVGSVKILARLCSRGWGEKLGEISPHDLVERGKHTLPMRSTSREHR